MEKGITLIALIITIVVLLILAAVAITSITETDLIGKAIGVTGTYNESVGNEVETIGGYGNFIDKYLNGGTTGSQEETVTLKDKNGVEHLFYVIEDGTNTMKLLAKYSINTTTLLQDPEASGVNFSSTNYWSTVEGITYPYDLVETGVPDVNHYAAYAAYQYGAQFEGATGRLLYYSEALELEKNNSNVLYGDEQRFWLGTASKSYSADSNQLSNHVYGINSITHSWVGVAWQISAFEINGWSFDVRPVLVVSKP